MAFTTSERIIINEQAYAAARAVVKDVTKDIKSIVENAMKKATDGDGQILKLLETIADAQVHAAGNYAATLKSELAAARQNSGKKI